MTKNNIDLAMAYYQAMNERNFTGVEKYLDSNVRFTTPLADLTGKEAVVSAIKGFMTVAKKVAINASFGNGDQVMLAYEVDFPAPIGTIPSATLMTFKDGFITRIQLFYDARPFETKKDEIFKK
jgi:hypothetical protein